MTEDKDEFLNIVMVLVVLLSVAIIALAIYTDVSTKNQCAELGEGWQHEYQGPEFSILRPEYKCPKVPDDRLACYKEVTNESGYLEIECESIPRDG